MSNSTPDINEISLHTAGTRMSIRLFLAILCLLIPALVTVSAQTFQHPGLRLSDFTLRFMKTNVLAKDATVMSAYNEMVRWKGYRDGIQQSLPSSPSYLPQPTSVIRVGPYEKPHTGQDKMLTDATAAYIHAINWYVYRQDAEAHKAMQIFSAWSFNLTQIDPWHNGELAAAWSGNILCEAAEIIRTTYPTNPKDWTAFDNMLRKIYYPIIKNLSKNEAGNWKCASTQCIMAIGVLLDDTNYYNQAKDYFLSDETALGSLRGYVHTDGTTRESARDQLHEQMGVLHLVNTCEIAWTQGDDLYGAYDNLLLKGLEGTADRVLSTGAVVYDGWDIAYRYYHDLKRLPTPKMDALRDSGKWSGQTWRYWTCGLWPKMTHRLYNPRN